MTKTLTKSLCVIILSLIGIKAMAQNLTPPSNFKVRCYVDKVRLSYYDQSTDETRFQVSKKNGIWFKYVDLPGGSGTAGNPVYQAFIVNNPQNSYYDFRIRAEKENGLFDKNGPWAYDYEPYSYLPDLTVIDATKNKTSAYPGNTVYLTCKVKNLKQFTSAASTLKYYLSKSSGGTDYYLGSDAVSSLGAYETSSETITITIPTSLTSGGTYYLVFVSDADNIIPESSGSNNKVSISITILGSPNIGVSCSISPFSITAGSPYWFYYTFYNNGTMASNSFSTSRGTCPALGIGQSYSFSEYITTSIYDSGTRWETISGGGAYCSSWITIEPYESPYSSKNDEGELFTNEKITIYPNPSDGLFTIRINDESYQNIKIFGIDGKLIMKEEINERNSIDINISDVPKGMYVIHLQSSNGVEVRKINIK